MLCLGWQGLLGTAHIFPECIRPGMQPGFCSSLLLAYCRQRPQKKLFLCSSLSLVAWKVVACIVAMVFLSFLFLKIPCPVILVSLLHLVGSFLLVCRHMNGSCHTYTLEGISPPLLLHSFLCFDCGSVCGKWNGMTWNDLRHTAWCKAKPGVKFWDSKEMEDEGPASSL